MNHEVFISYCTEDSTVAEAVCGALESAGLKCWMAPRDVRPGENWGRSIIKAIAGSKLMVLVFSGHTNTSRHVNNEIERAVSHGITILPFRIEKVQPSEDLELFISSCHWLDAYTPPLDARITQLVTAVRGVASGEAGAARPQKGPDASPPQTRDESAAGANGKGGKLPVVFGAVAAVAAVAATAFYLTQQPRADTDLASATTQAEPVAVPTAPPAEEEPSKELPAAPGEDELLKARQLEDDQNFVGALAEYAAMLARDRDNKDIRNRAENVIARLEEKAGDKPPSYRLLDVLNDLTAVDLTRAMTFLAKLLRTSDPAESMNLFRAAGDAGDRTAMVEAGLMIASGHGVERPDYGEAAAWFKKASDGGNAEGMRLYADCLLDGMGVEVNEAEAARLYSAAMTLGNVPAKSRLAMLYRSGRGMESPDPAMAFKLFEEAAQDGFLEAQGNLGVMYMNGETVEADPEKAVSLWKEGAEKGDEICMVFYATALENGAVGKPDKEGAKEWYRKAARLRNARAIDWCIQNGVAF